MRGDHYNFDVNGLNPANAGEGSDGVLSPKFSLAYEVRNDLELYGAYGYGFHSNDVSGVVQTQDPNTGLASAQTDLIVKGKGGEIGARYHPSSNFNISVAFYHLDLDSELIFVGDAGTSEPSEATKRQGFELGGFWKFGDIFAVDATASWSDAKFANTPTSANKIPNSVDFTAAAGVTAVFDNGISGSLRLRHLGEAALTEDNAVRSDTTTLVNLGVSKDFGRFSLGVDILNLLDSDDNDITYFYESQLRGENTPIEDIHFHRVHPRAIKLTLRMKI